MTNSTFYHDGYRAAKAGHSAAPVDQGVQGQEYMQGFNEGLRQVQAASVLAEIRASHDAAISAMPGSIYIDECSAGVESITNEFELHCHDSEDGDSEVTILLVFLLTVLCANAKPMALLTMDSHITEVGVNDRHWINLSDDAQTTDAAFNSAAKSWGVPAERIAQGLKYIAKCRDLASQMGDQIALSELRN